MAMSEKWLAMLDFSVPLASKVSGALLAVNVTAFGGVFGVTVTHMLERGCNEIIQRKLAPRQNARAGRAIAVACIKLKEHQDQGRNPRDDGFFDDDAGSRSAADEVTEATLLAAMNSAQEQKVDFIGALLANVAMDSAIDVPTAHLLIELANTLS